MNLSTIGYGLMRVGVAALLLWFGLFKFTPTEAEGIKPFLQFSPFLSWMLPVFGPRVASDIVGAFEIVTAVLLFAGAWQARLSLAGGVLGSIVFGTTLTFLVSTPGMFQQHDGMWVPDGFLAKDIVLLGFCLVNVAQARLLTKLSTYKRLRNQSVTGTT